MNTAPAACDLSLARLRLRDDLGCTLQSSGGKPYYLVEDPLSGRFFRFGLPEWAWASQLDGRRTVRDMLLDEGPDESAGGLSRRDKQDLCRWLVQMQLAVVAGSTGSVAPGVGVARRPGAAGWLNLFFIRIPLFNPDRLLTRCLPWMAWSLGPVAFVGWLTVCLLAGVTLWLQADRFTAKVPMILAADNWLYLLLAWLLLKVVHEFYHGLVCKKYGGYVPRCGLLLILFSPVAFVDVTSSWRFRSKWQRIYTAAAGMYVELFIASMAALIWARTESGLVSQLCHNLVTMASVSTLLFNGNFLMRFDGYYILSDLLGFQNLYGAGQQYLHYFRRRHLFGVAAEPPALSNGRLRFVRVYAWATLLWRLLFYAGMLIVSASMFQGAGIALAVIAGLCWFLLPAWRFLRYLCVGLPREQPNRWRFAAITSGCGLIIGCVLALPWPGGVTAWGVVDFEPLSVLRVSSPGFVRQVHVRAGERVEPGQLLATIENPQIALDLAQLDLAIEQSQVRARVLHRDRDLAEYQAELKHRVGLQQQRDELVQRVDGLMILATTSGRVIGRNVDVLQGQYLPMGATLMSVGDERHKQIQLSLAQKDVDFFLQQLDCQPHVRVKGQPRPIRNACLSRVNPRASHVLPHAALASSNGGPLSVRVADASTGTWELSEPRFLATISLSEADASQLRAGELARVRIGAAGDSMGTRLLACARRWMHHKLRARGLDD